MRRDGPAGGLDTPALDAAHQHVLADLDAESAELRLGDGAQLLGIGGQDAGAALEQHDRRLARIDVPEIARQGVSPQLGDGGGHLDSGRTTTYHHEGEMGVAPGDVGLPLGLLEGEEHALPNIERVVEGLEPGSEGRPRLVLAVVGCLDARWR